ncbi:MAG: PilZ domain-containing protein [Planctomycetes bacterium]|nr:PilZ domain-containing protein [Planctomycetota bacterium]
MGNTIENRHEPRLAYRWPVWFGEDVTRAVFPGLMEDVSSGGLAFTCQADQGHLRQGQQLTVRFSLPRFDGRDTQATVGITRTGHICWAAPAGPGAWRIGLQFDVPLSLKPAEEAALATLCPNDVP